MATLLYIANSSGEYRLLPAARLIIACGKIDYCLRLYQSPRTGDTRGGAAGACCVLGN
jgi:hypothetical protein